MRRYKHIFKFWLIIGIFVIIISEGYSHLILGLPVDNWTIIFIIGLIEAKNSL